jgi:hypothetical protein
MQKTRPILILLIIILVATYLLPVRELIDPDFTESEIVNVPQIEIETNSETKIQTEAIPVSSTTTATDSNNTVSPQNNAQTTLESNAAVLLASLEAFEPTLEESEALKISAQTRFAESINRLQLNPEDEMSLINLIMGVLEKEYYLGLLVTEGIISQESFRRLSTTTEDMTLALSSFLTEEEMVIYDDYLEGSEQRFLNRWEVIMLDQVEIFMPELSQLLKNLVVGIFIDELGKLRSGEGGVLSNEHLRTAFAKTNERLQIEKRLNQLDLELMQDYLDDQIQGIPP